MYAKDPYEVKYQLLINKREGTVSKYLNDSKAFIEYANDMDEIYKNIEEYNPNKIGEILIVFDDIIADTLSNKKLDPILTELFIRGKKLNISRVLITQSYSSAPKIIRLNLTHYFGMKIPKKRELQKIDFQEFMNLYKKCTTKPYYFLFIDTTLPSDNFLRFRKNVLERK